MRQGREHRHAGRAGRHRPPRWRRLLRRAGLVAAAFVAAGPAAAQDPSAVRLELQLTPDSAARSREPTVRTRNLLEDTPWLSALRRGLPVRLQYRLEVWRSREGWFDVLDRQLEWTVVVRHEPLLDQFTMVRLLPTNRIESRRFATPGGLAEALGQAIRFQIAPRDAGRYYYAASLDVTTLSDSDLDQLDRVLRGELNPGAEGTSLAQRVRRLVLRLAGLPTASYATRSEVFEVR